MRKPHLTADPAKKPDVAAAAAAAARLMMAAGPGKAAPPTAVIRPEAGAGFVDVLRLLPSPEPGDVALSLEAASLIIDPKAKRGVDAPLILAPGEACGRIEAVGDGVTGLTVGQRVAISWSAPCGACGPCKDGAPGFCVAPQAIDPMCITTEDDKPEAPLRGMTVHASRCVPLQGAAPAAAALLFPFAAALHAVQRAGPVLGRRALVCGASLEGALIVAALHMAGAAEIVALGAGDGALDRMTAAGADAVIDAAAEGAAAEALRGGARFDLCIDATGAAAALAIAAEALRPMGVLVLAGRGDASGPVKRLAVKEIELRGAARSFPDTAAAAALLRSGRAAGIGALPDVFAADRMIDAAAYARDAVAGVRAMLVWPSAKG
ncbi:MAG: L-idonate 5-dehydrogenase [Paracoccaceae bacterium]|jgi:L-idonate 5-dehydrogenase